MEQAYLKSCPRCGSQLQPNVLGPETPPWRCDACRTSYWVAELTQQARLSYRPQQRDWGHRGSLSHKQVRVAVGKEREEACRRGVSLRREQIGLVRPRALESLLKRGYVISSDFEVHLRSQL